MLEDGSLAFVEIAGQRVSRVDGSGKRTLLAHVPGGPNGLAMGPDGCLYICNNGGLRWDRQDGSIRPLRADENGTDGRIERLDYTTEKLECLYDRCDGVPLGAPNDLTFDQAGGFYFTDTGKNLEWGRQHGRIFHALADGSKIRQIAAPMVTPNGIGLSPDGRSLYVAETETARLWRFAISSPGVIVSEPYPSPHGGRFHSCMSGFHRFDSLAVEMDGSISVCTLVSGGVATFSPDGRMFDWKELPDLFCTNICVGGEDGRTAYITLSMTGRIATMRWERPGMVLSC